MLWMRWGGKLFLVENLTVLFVALGSCETAERWLA